MTITAESPVRHRKTNPECPARRHRPEHASYARGCRCPDTVRAEEEYRTTHVPAHVKAAKPCTARRHSATNESWKIGCRCPGAVRVHLEWNAETGRRREAAIAAWHRTGECAAPSHDTRYAYMTHGCRCDLAIKLDREWKARKPKRTRVRSDTFETVQLVVGRSSLMMLLAGYPDDPTPGEIMAADIRLQTVRAPNGPWRWRRLTVIEIAERLRVDERQIFRLRRERDRLRKARHRRRLSEVQRKVARAAAAPSRRAAEKDRHEAGRLRRQAQWRLRALIIESVQRENRFTGRVGALSR